MVTRTLLNVTLYVHCLSCKCVSKFVLPTEIQQRIAFRKDTASTVQPFVKVTFSDYEAANTFVTLSLPTQFGADAASCRGQFKCDGTRAETRFRLSAKRTSPFKSAGRQFSRLLAAEVCASAVVMVIMLNIPCSEVVWRVLATHYIRQFPLYFPSRASPRAITFPLESNAQLAQCHFQRAACRHLIL
jgi:hypothetical protein